MFSGTKVDPEKKELPRAMGSLKNAWCTWKCMHDLETESQVTVVPTKEPLDPAAPALYLPQLQKATKEESHVPAQIFGAVETAMLWKPLNNQSCLPSEEHEPTDADMRPAKTERLVFLFCVSSSGDLTVKPLLSAENQAHILSEETTKLSFQYTGMQIEKPLSLRNGFNSAFLQKLKTTKKKS